MGSDVTGDGTVETGLGGSADLGEIQLERSDDGSLQIDVSAVFEVGLNHFGQTFAATEVWVNTNGTVSFGSAFAAYPTLNNATARLPMIGVFWGDVDTRLRGEGLESGQVHVDIDPSRDVVSFTWDNVGVYRRDTSNPNLFQLQLFDRGGGDYDIVLRYQTIGWTEGTAANDDGARVVFSSPRLVQNFLPVPAGSDLSLLDSMTGNTGVTGLWVFQMRGGSVSGAQVVTGDVQNGSSGADTMTGSSGSDLFNAGLGDDVLYGEAGNDTLLGGAGRDTIFGGLGDDFIYGGDGPDETGNVLFGGAGADWIEGSTGSDILIGEDGPDTLFGGPGADTLNGGAGDDVLYGGTEENDLRDVIYGGDGRDVLEGGAGNDELNGGNDDDSLIGGLGSDTLIGHAGADTISGSGGSDAIFGNDGNDFINGGFGYDRLNGGAGSDVFFHLGVADHGSDWIQDYTAAQSDILRFGLAGATRDQFQVNFAHTANPEGIRAGSSGIAEAFVIYRPTGQIIWALVDGAGAGHIYLQLGTLIYDILA